MLNGIGMRRKSYFRLQLVAQNYLFINIASDYYLQFNEQPWLFIYTKNITAILIVFYGRPTWTVSTTTDTI